MKRIVMLTGLCAVLCHIGCKNKEVKTEEESKYAVTSPLKLDTSFTKEYVSQIKSVRNIEIRALEKGFLQKIYVDEGQSVKAGQLLFKIMPKMYEAELAKATAEAKSSEIELQNTKLLSDKNVVSKMNTQWRKPSLIRQKPRFPWRNSIFLLQRSGRHLTAQ